MEQWLVLLGIGFVAVAMFPWKVFDRPVKRRQVRRPLTDRDGEHRSTG